MTFTSFFCADAKTKRKALRVLGLLIAVFVISGPLLSQTSEGTIQGAVSDQTGGVIAGTTVTVVDVARGVTRALTTDNAGQS